MFLNSPLGGSVEHDPVWQFPDRYPTGFCNSEPDPVWTEFRKTSTGSNMDIQTVSITAVWCLIRGCFGYKPDWIKYWDRCTGLGSDRITQQKFWTGLGLQKSPMCSTLLGGLCKHFAGAELGCYGTGFSSEMTTQTPATAEIEKWLRIRFWFFKNF